MPAREADPAPATPPTDPDPQVPQDRYAPRPDTRRPNWLMQRQDRHGELRIDAMKRSDMARPASQISRRDMIRVFGQDGATLHDLAKTKPDITIGHLMQLKRVDSSQVGEVADLLSKRSDLGLNDVMAEAGNGMALLKPATYDEPSRNLLEERQGVRPDDLAALGDQFRHSYGGEAGRAYGKATDLLAYRTDLDAGSLEAEARGVPSLDPREAYQRFEDRYGDHNFSRPVFDLIA